jgi:hypothetical protein
MAVDPDKLMAAGLVFPVAWRRLGGGAAEGGGAAACLLSPVKASPVGDDTGSRAGSLKDGITFLVLFRDSIAILFCIQDLLCKKVRLVCNFK